jgi:hypothetical protein
MSSISMFIAGMMAGVALVVFLACVVGIYFAENIEGDEL